MKIFLYLVLAAALAGSAVTNADTPAPLFSSLTPGQTLPKQFRVISLPKVAINQFTLVTDAGKTVLRVDSSGSAGSLGLPLVSPQGTNVSLEWRWKVSRALEKADMSVKSGDDYAGRVYVFFDVPLASLSFIERSKIRLARALAGVDVPTAALCYVWANSNSVGHTQWSTYTNRVRMIVVQSGEANVKKWINESRDVNADFRAAFGFDAPAVTGVAVGNDTDNTGEIVTTWFGDVALRSR
jgi:hypothetical protein